MDYVVGSVAALISGNVTPNRPRLVKRALTPVKHQPSPNVTPKSEFVDDRSIFLSPTLQKKKAIVKKSPKRIFQNPDLDLTNDGEGAAFTSPKAEKVKKHLKDDLENDKSNNGTSKKDKSPKSNKTKLNKSVDSALSEAKDKSDENLSQSYQIANENTPKKKKKKSFISAEGDIVEEKENLSSVNIEIGNKSPKKGKRKSVSGPSEPTDHNQEETEVNSANSTPKKKKRKSQNLESSILTVNTIKDITDSTETNDYLSPKKVKKQKKLNLPETQTNEGEASMSLENLSKKKNKKQKKKKKIQQNLDNYEENTTKVRSDKKLKKKSKINPNAITYKDSDSEHESDNEINSDTEQSNNQLLDTGPVSSDEEELEEEKNKAKNSKKNEEKELDDAEVIKRTLFVGNVPFSNKVKKEIKKIFNKYGHIETVRIRAVPVKDARTTPKLAVIKSELHPERSTVHLYIKFKDPESVDKALAENNTVLNGYHLRVTRSDSTGHQHDNRCSLFVGNLPFALEDEALRAKFEQCGEIESVRIVRDKTTNVGKGFGYVNFKSKDGVELALTMTEEDLTIKNRILRVKRCTASQNKPGQKTQGHMPQQKHQGQKQHRQNNPNRPHFQRNQNQQERRGQMRPGEGSRGRMQPGQNNRGQMQQGGKGSVKQRDAEGAFRRIMNKRPHEKSADGPPQKRSKHLNQPEKEKKQRKEFVGMTAEKKKKRKFDKNQKKKKAISEILSKKVA